MPVLEPAAVKVRLKLSHAHGDKTGSGRLGEMRCAHHTVVGSCVPIQLRCVPCYAQGSGRGLLQGALSAEARLLRICPGCAMGSVSACCMRLPPRLRRCSLALVFLQPIGVRPPLSRLRGNADLTPLQPRRNELVPVVSSTAVLEPSPNPPPDINGL